MGRAFTALFGLAPRGTEVVNTHGDKRRFAKTASRQVKGNREGVKFKMRSNRKGLLKGASLLALGMLTLVPAMPANAQTWEQRRRQERREERREDRQERREERREERRGREWGNYGGWGGSQQLRQTALNAGYNNGAEEGRRDRQRNERFNFTDESDYRKATEDYSSRLGNKALYQRFFRQGFENGYRDGWNGY